MIQQEVERILTSPDPDVEIGKHLDNIIAGEEQNKNGIFKLLISGKRRNPKKKQIILLKGTEGGGKTTLLKIADLFNTKDVGRFSEHALDYSDLSGFEVLRLKEIGAMDEEKQGVSTLKFLSADDRGYTVEVTVREEGTGAFTTKQYRIPPITLITSTTRVILDPQFERRAWIFNPDESEEQTKRIREWKAKNALQEYEVSLGIREKTDEERSTKILRELVKSLQDIDVIAPFPKTLFSILETGMLRVRGDYDKILNLIENDAIFLQKVLPSVKLDGKHVVFTTPERVIKVLERFEDPLTSMLLELEKRTRKLIDVLEKLKITEKNTLINKDTRNTIARELGRSEKAVYRYLAEWEDTGYLSSDDRKPKTYTLLYDLDELKRKSAGISDKLKSADDLIVKMREEGQNWLKDQSDKLRRLDLSNVGLSSIQAVQPERSVNHGLNGKCPMISTPKPPISEGQHEDWKSQHPDFFIGNKHPLKTPTKPSGVIDVCYTCWMAPKNKYQQMLQAGTLRWEPLSGETPCELCRKEPAGFRVIL